MSISMSIFLKFFHFTRGRKGTGVILVYIWAHFSFRSVGSLSFVLRASSFCFWGTLAILVIGLKGRPMAYGNMSYSQLIYSVNAKLTLRIMSFFSAVVPLLLGNQWNETRFGYGVSFCFLLFPLCQLKKVVLWKI